MKPTLSRISLIGIILLSFLNGYLIGRIVDTRLAMVSVPPLRIVSNTQPLQPVVQIEGIRNGYLEGTMLGDARFFLGKEQVLPTASGSFRVLANTFLRNEVQVLVPEGMHFVASKKGKKYYPIISAAANNLAPQNRVYFRTEEEAKGAGYSP
jgi:hypothetical protein